MTTRDHNEGVDTETALQRLQTCVNNQGLRTMLIPFPLRAALNEGTVNANISPSISGGIRRSGERIALLRFR
jgi:hypothetical protein